MFLKKKTPKSGAIRLQLEMASIADQAIANAGSLREGHPLAPIAHCETETLFSEKNADGQTIYNHYHFSEDMSQLDPEAQIHLMRFFGQILAFNDLLKHPGVEKRLDWIAANASFFERYFARGDMSTEILTGLPADEVTAKMRIITDADIARVNQVLPAMFAPNTFAKLLPRPTIPFMFVMGKPHEEGQTFINGVYFSADHAPAVMDWIVGQQAQAVQNNNPACA